MKTNQYFNNYMHFWNGIFLKLQYHLFFKKLDFFRKDFVFEKVIIAASKTTILKDPKNVLKDNLAWSPPSWFKKKTSNEIIIYQLKKSFITTDGVIIKKFDSFSPSIVYSNFKKRFNHDYAYHQLKHQKHKIKEDIFLIWDHWAKENYFHWMIDSLSRLIIAIEFNSTPCIVLHESMPNFIFETLKAFPEIKFISIKKNTLITSENIYMPGYVISSGFMEKDFGKKVRNRFLDYLATINLKIDKGDKIYVSRSKQKIRKLINEEKLTGLLIDQGFSIINFEDYSFWEQVKIMSNASVLISPHGSNLVNMLFMKENSTVIEINKEDTQNATLCYWSMAESLEFDYYYIPAMTLDDNFVADDQLIKRIKSIII